ncbi:MAG: pentapeptide repeat-containing protein [Methyloligellaceae bacterium]
MQHEAKTSRDDPVYSDLKIQGLLRSINEASSGASSGWVLFISAMAYFFIAMAGISHQDFLLNSAVNQPILQVEVDLHLFFLFAPLVLVFVHFGILIQHETLASKVRAFDHALFVYEGVDNYRAHPIRRELSGYFFTQVIGGPRRSRVLLMFLSLMSWFTLFVLPITTLLAFQVTYLPYHDEDVTFWHRVYLIADIIIFLIMGTLYRFLDGGFLRGLSRDIRYHTSSFLMNNLVAISAVFFALFIATLPDSPNDKMMSKFWPAPVPYGWTASNENSKPDRTAFLPTAYLFEGKLNEGTGTLNSIFSRNLIVTDKDLVKDSTWNPKETTLSLRARNLKYAIFDRSDMRGTDFSNSDLEGARFYRTNLNSVKFDYAILRKADMREAIFAGKTSMYKTDLTSADLRKARFEELHMQLAKLRNAKLQEVRADTSRGKPGKLNLEGADLRNAELQRAIFSHGSFLGANMKHAKLQGAVLDAAQLQGVDFTGANLSGARLAHADLTGAIFTGANLQGANLEKTKLYGVELKDAKLTAAYFRKAMVWHVKALTLGQLELTDLRELKIAPAEDYYGEYNILRQIEDNETRRQVQARISPLLNRQNKLGWKNSKDFATWDALKGQKPTPDKVSEFFAKTVCDDVSINGYVAQAFVFRAERRYAQYGSIINYRNYAPPVNPETFLNKISDPKCGGAKSVPPTAMFQLMKTVSGYRKDIEKFKAYNARRKPAEGAKEAGAD